MKLYGYQEESKKWLSEHRWGILGDEMGVGKSYPTLHAALELPGRKLIVCPKYLVNNWVNYLAQCGVEDAVPVVGSPRQKVAALDKDADWTIITYEMLGQTNSKSSKQSYYAGVIGPKWEQVICDEAHRMRNRKALCTGSARLLKTNGMWLLTGSPLYRGPDDIFSLLQLVNRPKFRSYWKWVEDYCVVETNPWKTEVVGIKDQQQFNKMLSEYMLRRTHTDVDTGIGELMEPQVVHVPLTPATNRNIKAIKDGVSTDDNEYFSMLNAVTSIRVLTASDDNKLDALKELISDLNKRVVVLCWFRESARKVAEHLKTDLLITGEIDALDRMNKFYQLEATTNGVAVATIESIKEGLNLQHTSNVVFYEQHWLSETNKQVRGRFHRVGQTERVQEYFVRGVGSVDERVASVADRRDKTIKEALFEELQCQLD